MRQQYVFNELVVPTGIWWCGTYSEIFILLARIEGESPSVGGELAASSRSPRRGRQWRERESREKGGGRRGRGRSVHRWVTARHLLVGGGKESKSRPGTTGGLYLTGRRGQPDYPAHRWHAPLPCAMWALNNHFGDCEQCRKPPLIGASNERLSTPYYGVYYIDQLRCLITPNKDSVARTLCEGSRPPVVGRPGTRPCAFLSDTGVGDVACGMCLIMPQRGCRTVRLPWNGNGRHIHTCPVWWRPSRGVWHRSAAQHSRGCRVRHTTRGALEEGFQAQPGPHNRASWIRGGITGDTGVRSREVLIRTQPEGPWGGATPRYRFPAKKN